MACCSGFGDLTRNAIRFFTDDFTGYGRTDVLFYCTNDGKWWLGCSDGNELKWSGAGNTGRPYQSSLRPHIKILTNPNVGIDISVESMQLV